MGIKLLFTILAALTLASCSKSQPVQVFSKAPQAPFAGASSVAPNTDGTFTLSWQPPAIQENLKYQIFEREDLPASLISKFTEFFNSSEARFATPHAVSKTTSWTSEILLFKPSTCFIVRVVSKQYKDKNTNEVCTNHTQYSFAGLQAVAANADNTYTLTWDIVPFIVATYDVFMRTEAGGLYNYNKPVATGLTSASYASETLAYKPSQCFMVRAIAAKDEFIDTNTSEICTKHTQQTLATPNPTPQSKPVEVANLGATAISSTSISILYTASTNASSYKISYAQGANAPADCITSNVTTTTNTTLILTDLQSDTAYSFRVCALNSSGDISLGSTTTGYTLQPAPANVTALLAISTGASLINLSWTAGTYNTSYKVAYQTGLTAPSTCALGTLLPANQISNTSASISGLSAGNYSFRVCALNGNATPDVSSGTTVSVTTLLEAPPNANTLLAVPTSDTVIGLTWTTGGGTTAGYNISYASGATAPATCALGTALPSGQISGATVTEGNPYGATVTGLTANTQYSFRVCSLNDNPTPDISSGITTSMTTLQAVPPNVTTLNTTVNSDTNISLAWTSGGGGTIGYNVSYASGVTAPATCALGTVLPSGQISGTIASVTGLTPNTQYSFRVCAVNGNATPDVSTGTTATATTLQALPPNVTVLTATVNSDTSISLAWTGGGGSTTGYKVNYASGATAPTTCALGTALPGGQISGTTVTEGNPYGASVTSLAANTQYSFRVCAVNTNATPDVSSGTTTSAATIKAAPADLSGTNGANKITLSWSTVSGASNYAIYYSTSASVTKAATRVVVAAPSYQVTGLASSTTYYFNIALIVGGTESDLSSHEVNATTYPIPPSAPSGLYLSFAYNKALQMHFNTVSGAASYKAYYKTSAGVTTSDTLVASVSNGYTLSGLNTFGTYYVKVSAVDAYGQESSLSNEASYQLYEYSIIPQNNASYNQLPSSAISRIYISGSTIYATTGFGISISTNAGSTWINKNMAHGLSSNYIMSVYAVGSTIYAATQAGISISTNAGLTWLNKSTANGMASNDARDIYVANTNIYVATYNAGLLLSTDNGVTWNNKTTANGLGSNEIRRIVVSGTNIYAATAAGLSISTDNGATWVNKTTANCLADNNVKAISMTGSTIYAPTALNLSISTNGGTNWTTTTTACGIGTSNIRSVYATGNNVYIIPNGGTVAVCVSTDSGSTWTAKTTANGLGGYYAIDVYANGSNVYASFDGGTNNEVGLSVSTDNGSTWTHTVPIITSGINRMIATGSAIYAATSTGLSISTDSGATWIKKNMANGLLDNNVKSVYVSASNIYLGGWGVSISTNSGSTWVNKTTANGLGSNSVKAIYADGGNLYAATVGGLSISTNGGTTWVNKTPANGLVTNSLLEVFALGTNIYAGSNGFGLSISTNGGTTWATKNTSNGIGENHINNIYHDGTSIYLATGNGVSISTDNGTTWVNKISIDFPDDYIYSVIVSNGKIYAASDYGIKISTDNGTSWLRKDETTGFFGDWITWIALSGTSVYLGGYNGLFASGL